MGNSLSDLRMDIGNNITIYPWKDAKDWATYTKPDGEEVDVPLIWREVGFICKYPSNIHYNHLDKLMSDRTYNRTQTQMTMKSGDIAKAVKYIVNTIIVKPLFPYDIEEEFKTPAAAKEMIEHHFLNVGFLFNGFYLGYQLSGGKVRKLEEEETADLEPGLPDGSIGKTSEVGKALPQTQIGPSS